MDFLRKQRDRLVNTFDLLRKQINHLIKWYDDQPEPKRLLLFMFLLTCGLLALNIGMAFKSRIAMGIGILAFIPVVVSALAKANELGYKNTVQVILLAVVVLFSSVLILSIF